MPSAGRPTIVVALVAALALLSASGTSHAAYGKLDVHVVRQKIYKDLFDKAGM